MDDLGRRGDLDSPCRALLTLGLAALGHPLKHVLGAIFCKISSPRAKAPWVSPSVGNVEEKSSKLLLALVMLFLFAVSVLQYVCPSKECQLLRLQAFSSPLPDPYRLEDESSARFVPRYTFSHGDLLHKVDFDIKGDDRILFLHIQKTGGTTFGRHPVGNFQLEQPYECRVGQKTCTCHRPGKRETWLFSTFSMGWSCGLHADWTELTSCVQAMHGAVAATGCSSISTRDGSSVCTQVGLLGGSGCAVKEAAKKPWTSAPRPPPGRGTECRFCTRAPQRPAPFV
ncbi:hypothetical protein FD755_024302 [Muntiacus reevesi]|uniref:Heparan-sulfate 6-O-sulfotransferase n=1 Tax=Muntiacus reevesi TaxID=9886 RepID=A0A5N3VAS9_MUNRE|nr:hypothetical protein FD755_024302 [Muntiacus reevesi]